jgi:hypothetical protein
MPSSTNESLAGVSIGQTVFKPSIARRILMASHLEAASDEEKIEKDRTAGSPTKS